MPKKEFDIISVGGAVRDFNFWSKSGKFLNTPENLTAQKLLAFEYGAKVNAEEIFCSIGGGASNTSASFVKLGLKTAALVRLGNDSDGKIIAENFKKHKVNDWLIQYDQKKISGISFILTTDKKEKDHVVFAFRGANENLEFPVQKFKKIRTKWIYITSLAGENWKKTLGQIFSWAQFNKVKVAWNPGIKQLQAGKKVLEKFLKLTNVIILNKDEAIELSLSGLKFGRKIPTHLNKPLYLLNILKEWGPKIVLITDGKRGAFCYDGKNIQHVKPLRKKIVDTTGVGDAFGAAFVSALIYHPGYVKEALRWGIINSNSVITQYGAQGGIVGKAEMLNRISKTKIIFT
ncbi:carbohydrate kinase family protein [Candidatus Parcubacteria bacterium]|nr:MAG: carbohydrate kinase family protein [Candidatus Parcubacteria bacterium]